MIKDITYKGKSYKIQIEWCGSQYCVRAIGVGGFHTIPTECLGDIEKIKPYIIKAIEDKHDLIAIQDWDGTI